MLDIILMFINFITLFIRLLLLGGGQKVASDNIVLCKQLITMARGVKRSPKLTTSDCIIFGMLASMISPKRLARIAIILKPATIFQFHKALVKRKYRLLFLNKKSNNGGGKGPDKSVIGAAIEMKKRNPIYGYRRIAMQISSAFGLTIDKDVVRQILIKNYKPNGNDGRASWLTFIGHMKDSLWSIVFFCCESIHLKTHSVMVVMDQFTRRIVGFSVHKGPLSGVYICCMFNSIISRKTPPKYLSSDNNSLFKFYRWQANLRILKIEEIKSVPYTPTSHPFVERLIGTCRREFLDKYLFWNQRDLQNKLESFQHYYNDNRCHESIDGQSPHQKSTNKVKNVISLDNYRWEKECCGLDSFSLPTA